MAPLPNIVKAVVVLIVKEYLSSLRRITKWCSPLTNLSVGDIIILCDNGTNPTQWSLARIVKTYPGNDVTFHVVTINTSNESLYTRPDYSFAPFRYLNLLSAVCLGLRCNLLLIFVWAYRLFLLISSYYKFNLCVFYITSYCIIRVCNVTKIN